MRIANKTRLVILLRARAIGVFFMRATAGCEQQEWPFTVVVLLFLFLHYHVPFTCLDATYLSSNTEPTGPVNWIVLACMIPGDMRGFCPPSTASTSVREVRESIVHFADLVDDYIPWLTSVTNTTDQQYLDGIGRMETISEPVYFGILTLRRYMCTVSCIIYSRVSNLGDTI